jgi:hypothetical protein
MLKKSIKLPPVGEMSKALNAVREIQLNHDARIMFLVFLDRAAHFGSQLKALGLETDESLESMFSASFAQAKKERKAPTITTPGGTIAESGRPS